MNCFVMRQRVGSLCRHFMTVDSDFYVRTCWAGSQGGCTDCSISMEEVVIGACRKDAEGVGEWRCLAVGKLSQFEFRADSWHTEPRSRRQTCVDDVDLDIDDQLGGEPQ